MWSNETEFNLNRTLRIFLNSALKEQVELLGMFYMNWERHSNMHRIETLVKKQSDPCRALVFHLSH